MKFATIRKLLRPTPANRDLVQVTLTPEEILFLYQTQLKVRNFNRLEGINPVYLSAAMSVLEARAVFPSPFAESVLVKYKFTPNELAVLRQMLLHYQALLSEMLMRADLAPILSNAYRACEAARLLSRKLHPSFLERVPDV